MRVSWKLKQSLHCLVVALCGASALQLNLDDPASIRSAAATIAYGLQSYYTYNTTGEPWQLGTFPFPPYYWWEAGAIWGGMVDYWAYTGDTSYVGVTAQALLAQAGPNNDYMMPQFFSSLANDDQAFWGLSAMSAAEYGFPKPSASSPDWVSLAQGVFDRLSERWDSYACGGGLRWQIDPNRQGYDYKNSVSNGAFFQLAARLARFTGNQDYANWAARTWEWVTTVGLVTSYYQVYDGTDEFCNAIEITQWTYNNALFLYGASMLYDYTNDPIWRERLDGLVAASNVFFSPFPNATDIMFEGRCELAATCNTDQISFKAYLSRWMGKTAILTPHTAASIWPRLRASAMGAAASCSGGASNVACGSKWYINGWDGSQGVGQQLSALEVIQAHLAGQAGPPSVQGEVVNAVAPVGTIVVIPAASSTTEGTPATSVTPAVESTPVTTVVVDANSVAGNTPATSVVVHASPAAEDTPATSVVVDVSVVIPATTSAAEGTTAPSVVVDANSAVESTLVTSVVVDANSAAEAPPVTSVAIDATTSAAESTTALSVVIDGSTSAAESTPATSVVIPPTDSAADGAQDTNSAADGTPARTEAIQGSAAPPSSRVISQPTPAATLVVVPGDSGAGTSPVVQGGTSSARGPIVAETFTLAATPVRNTNGASAQNTGPAQAGSITGTTTRATTGPNTGATTGPATGAATNTITAGAASPFGGPRLRLAGFMASMVCFGSVAISLI